MTGVLIRDTEERPHEDGGTTQGAPGASRDQERQVGRSPHASGGTQPRRYLDFGLPASRSVRVNFCCLKPPSLWSSITEDEKLQAQRREVPGEIPALTTHPLSSPVPPATTTSPRTPHPHSQAADYDERSVNTPASAISKLVSLQERRPDKNTQTQEASAGGRISTGQGGPQRPQQDSSGPGHGPLRTRPPARSLLPEPCLSFSSTKQSRRDANSLGKARAFLSPVRVGELGG